MIKTFLGIDPGKTTGLARIDVDIDLKKIVHTNETECGWDLFCVILSSMEVLAQERSHPITVIMEDFLLFQHKAKAQIGSRMEATQVIGAVKYVVGSSKGKINLTLQPSSINPIAAKWSGRAIKQANDPNLHIPNPISAYNHVYYYLVNNSIIPHRILNG